MSTELPATSAPATTSPFSGRRWIDLFESFIIGLRIESKELAERDSRGAKLNLWTSQKLFLTELSAGLESDQRSFAFLKSRQCGITTVSLAIDVFWLAMFPGTRGALVVDSDANRMKFRVMLKNYIASFPGGFFGKSFAIRKGKDNKDFIHFTNGSTLDFLVAGKKENKSLGEGSGYNFVHATECANYGDPDGLRSFRETMSDTHPNRLYMYESTAKGFNHWRDMYLEHQRDTITKRACFIGWWAKDLNAYRKTGGTQSESRLFHIYGSQPPSPEEREKIKIVHKRHGVLVTQEQLAWYRHRQSDQSTDEGAIEQNQPWYDAEAFVMSGSSFFPTRTLAKVYEHLSTSTNPENSQPYGAYEPFRFLLSNAFLESRMERVVSDKTLVELRVWEHPHPHGLYAIGIDPAWGREGHGDNSCISVWRSYADRFCQVAEYAANMKDTRQVAWIMAYLAGAYRNCHLNIEISGGVGLAVLNEFKSLRQLLAARNYAEANDARAQRDWSDFLGNARWFLYSKYDSVMRSSNTTQFNTTRDLKFAILNSMRDSLAKNELDLRSIPLVSEMQSFIQDTDRSLGAPEGQHDDRVMAAALAHVTWTDMQRAGLLADNATYAVVNSANYRPDDEDESAPEQTKFMRKLVIGHFRKAESAEAEREDLNYKPKWMRERGLI